VPGEQYKYWVGQHESVWSFQAPLQPGPDAGFSFVVYGDMGEADHKAAKSPGYAFVTPPVPVMNTWNWFLVYTITIGKQCACPCIFRGLHMSSIKRQKEAPPVHEAV